jgi:transcriptional regulator with XRE-family HTH domain
MRTFSKILIAFRQLAALSQQALADEAELNRVFVNRLEQGKAEPSLSTLEALSKALGSEFADAIRDERLRACDKPKKSRKKAV